MQHRSIIGCLIVMAMITVGCTTETPDEDVMVDDPVEWSTTTTTGDSASSEDEDSEPDPDSIPDIAPPLAFMEITSSAFMHNERIPARYTCDESDTIPPLAFSNVSEEAKSLVLIVDDPDAPGGTWTHWLLWNINPDAPGIDEGNVPTDAVQGINSWGRNDYGGPCPPTGEHRYVFTLYALDTRFDLPDQLDVNLLRTAMEGNIIDEAELIGLYERE